MDDLRASQPGGDLTLVSVVIACYNGQSYVQAAVGSVLAQTYRDLELIVVDDGSTDDSVSLVAAVSDARVSVVAQVNSGVAAARNRGAAAARGEYLAFLDQDDLWLPDKLRLQLERFRTCPEAGLVYSDCLLIAEDGTGIGRWSQRYRLLRGRIFEGLIVESVVPISTIMLRRALFEQVGGFRSYRYVEDLDLILRVAEHHAIEVVDVPMAKYRLHAESTSRRLGLEVAVQEMVAVCDGWIAQSPSRAAAVNAALARYLYTAGKTAFYQGRQDLAVAYLKESARRGERVRAALFAGLVRYLPGIIRWLRAHVNRWRGQAGPTPGTFKD
jgi:glycosyltransferase involved in cell wall biosynthesis